MSRFTLSSASLKLRRGAGVGSGLCRAGLYCASMGVLRVCALVVLGMLGFGESAAHTINSKTNSTPNLVVGGIATYTISVSSAGQTASSTGMTTVDTLPPGFAYRSTTSITLVNGATNTGTVVPTPGSSTPSWGLFTNPNNSTAAGSPVSSYSITFDADVLNPTCGSSVTNSANTVGGTQHALLVPATNTAPLNITGPTPAMTVSKTTATPVIVNSGSGLQAVYTIVVSNAAGTCAATGVNITDTLPAGFTYASNGAPAFTGSPASASRPGGSDPTVGAATPTWSGFVIPAGSSVSLTFTANIANGTTNGTYNNSAAATAAQSGTTVGNFGPGAPVQLVSVSLTKAFSPALIAVGGTSTLTFTITKPAGASASGLSFVEALPANVTVSGVPTAAQCGGTVTSTASSITLTGGTIATAATSCTVTASVTSAVAGVYTNTSNNISGLAGLSAAAVNATLTVTNAALTKAFLTPLIGAGGNSVMRFTLTNGTPAAHSGMGFTETLPAGVTVVAGFGAAQCGGTVASSGAQNVTITSASLAANASCNIDVTVTSALPGSYVNGASQITGLAGGLTANGVNATLTVSGTILSKSFTPNAIGVGGTSLLIFTINNSSGSPAQSALAFTETLPTNITRVAGFVAAQCGGTLSSSGAQNFTFTGGSLAAGVSQCTINAKVTGTVTGSYLNASAQISGASAGMDTSGVNATLTIGNVVLSKSFANSPVNTSSVLPLTFTLTNSPGNPAQSALAFTDTFPAGLILADAITSFGAGCTGTLTNSSGAPLAAGGPGVKLSAGTMSIGTTSCNVTVDVTSNTPGTYTNNAGNISAASNGLVFSGLNAAAQFSGALLVVTKSTTTPTVSILGAANGVATYTVTVSNNGNASESGITLTDTLPAGFTYASSGSITLNGGATRPSTTSPSVGATLPAWSSFTIPASGAVVITFNASIANATANGTYNNSASVTSGTAGTGITNYDGTLGANTAEDVTVQRLADLTLSKAQITPNPVVTGQTGVQFTLTVNNIGGAAKASPNQVSVTDSAPGGMTITAMSGTGWTCTIPTCTRTDVLAPAASYAPINVTVSIAYNAASSLTNSSSVVLSGQTESNTNNNVGSAPATQVIASASLTKASSPNPIGVNQPSTLTFTVINGNGNPPQSALAFADTLPSGVIVATPAGVTNTCGGAITATAGSASISLLNGALGAGVASCAIGVQITSAVAGRYTNNAANISALGGGLTASGLSDTLVVRGSALSKAFSPTSVGIGQPSALTLTITNGSGNPAQSALAFTDTFPSGMTIASPNALANTCGGTVSAVAGSALLTLIGGTLSAGTANCTLTINVIGASVTTYNNGSGNLSGASAGLSTAGIAATLTVVPPLTINKAFSPANIASAGVSLLTITLTNGNGLAVNGAAFIDTYPSGMVNTATPAAATTCAGGSVTAANGGGSLGLTAGIVPANGSCSVTVNVSAASAGAYNNSTGVVTSTNAGSAAAASASLTVLAVPIMLKSFNPTSIGASAPSTMTLTITNGNAIALTGIAFSDSYPAGLVDASIPNLTNSCGGVTAGGIAGGSSVGLSGGTLAANGTCVVTVSVTSATGGTYTNVTGAVSSANGGVGTSASAALTVLGKPRISKAFSPTSIAVGGSSTLSLTIINAGSTALTGLAFSDAFPANLSVAATPALSNGCGGTIAGGTSGSTTLALSNGSLAASSSCIISVAVTVTSAGTYNNTAGGVSATETGSAGAVSNVAQLTVIGAPSVAKSFSPPVIGIGGNSTLTLTFTNNSSVAQTNVALTDNYPSQLVNGGVPNPTNTCGGTLTGGTAAGSSLGLSAGTIAANSSCAITVQVTSSVVASYNNVTGTVASGNGGAGNTGSATLTVAANPSISNSFAPATIAQGGVSTLTFVLSNSATSAATSAGFTNTFPAGLVVASVPAVSSTCGGTFSASSGAGSVTLTGATIPATGNCTLTVNVTAAAAGSYPNTTSAVASSLGSGSASNTAILSVSSPPSIVKSFNPTTILANGTSTISFVISNPNALALSAMGFTDNFPSGGLQVAAAPNLTNTCGGSVSGATPGSVIVALSGGTLAASASCTITIVVTSPIPGSFSNATTGVSSAQTSTGAGANATLLTVVSPNLRLSKSHSGDFIVGVQGAYTLLVDNIQGTAPTSGTISVVDTLPGGLTYVAAGSGGTGWSCTVSGQVVTCTSSTILAAGASGSNLTIQVAVAATGVPAVTNSAAVSGGGEPAVNAGDNNAIDRTVVVTANQNTFAPDGVQSALPGTTLFYSHQFNAGLAGSVTFSANDVPTPGLSGWSSIIYRDSNCNAVLDGSEGTTPLSAAISVNPGDIVCIIVKIFVPASAPYNSKDITTLTATFVPSVGATLTYTRTDTTTVGTGGAGLVLQKTVRNVTASGPAGISNAAKSGDILEYLIAYSDTSTDPLASIAVADTTPAFTTFVSAGCGAPLPPNITACSVGTQPAVGNSGAMSWTLTGTLAPQQSGTVIFRVTLQ